MSTQNYIYSVIHKTMGLENGSFSDLESAEKWRDFITHGENEWIITKIEPTNYIVPEWFNMNDLYYFAYISKECLKNSISNYINIRRTSGQSISHFLRQGDQLDIVYLRNNGDGLLYTKANSLEEAKEKAINLFEDWFNKNN